MNIIEKNDFGVMLQNLTDEQKAKIFESVWGYYSGLGGTKEFEQFVFVTRLALDINEIKEL